MSAKLKTNEKQRILQISLRFHYMQNDLVNSQINFDEKLDVSVAIYIESLF